ncbi:MAG TPA: fasciclin domain-containing protein [Chitinophagaceae bacterium]|nr:fasciclin domain-containing protein [Chitinophagaceae bacterium]
MKQILFAIMMSVTLWACNEASTTSSNDSASSEDQAVTAGQSAVQDDESQKDVVKVAAGSKDHTTLVKAVKKAELVDALSNAGPFTVFAPTNAAFDKVPKETLNSLMKTENKEQLQDILQYHVFVGILRPEMLQDGQTYNQVNGGNITISNKDGKIVVNNSANVIASIPASNGIIHVVDGVLLPPGK